MIAGIGIDMVDIARIQQAVEQYGTRFLDKVFTPREQKVYTPGRSCERLAARFAAKEAVMKVLGTGWSDGVTWRDIEIVSEGGRPYVNLYGKAQTQAQYLGIGTIHISLTHAQEIAGAVAIGETETEPKVVQTCES